MTTDPVRMPILDDFLTDTTEETLENPIYRYQSNYHGTNGDDTYRGHDGHEDINGYGGNDVLQGASLSEDGIEGKDTIKGHKDDDYLFLTSGHALGGSGEDVIYHRGLHEEEASDPNYVSELLVR